MRALQHAALALGFCSLVAGCVADKDGGGAGPKAGAVDETAAKHADDVQPGKPYQIAGKWYTPEVDPDYDKEGTASWYGPRFHGRRTANGEIFDRGLLTAAHPTLPLPSYVRVTNLANARSVVVRVNDRGPFSRARLIDVSERAADLLGFKRGGVAAVRVQYVDRAGAERANEQALLLASYRAPEGAGAEAARTVLASAAPLRERERTVARAREVQVAAVELPRPERPQKGRPAKTASTVAFALDEGGRGESAAGVAAAVGALTAQQPVDDRISLAFDLISDPPN